MKIKIILLPFYKKQINLGYAKSGKSRLNYFRPVKIFKFEALKCGYYFKVSRVIQMRFQNFVILSFQKAINNHHYETVL